MLNRTSNILDTQADLDWMENGSVDTWKGFFLGLRRFLKLLPHCLLSWSGDLVSSLCARICARVGDTRRPWPNPCLNIISNFVLFVFRIVWLSDYSICEHSQLAIVSTCNCFNLRCSHFERIQSLVTVLFWIRLFGLVWVSIWPNWMEWILPIFRVSIEFWLLSFENFLAHFQRVTFERKKNTCI